MMYLWQGALLRAAGDNPTIACACKWHLSLKAFCLEETRAQCMASILQQTTATADPVWKQ